MIRRLVFALLLAACSKPSAPATTVNGEGATPAGPVVTLEDLQHGDRACYVVVDAGTAEAQSIEGDFELCAGGSRDATALIGKRVTYTTEKAKVQAASCQGDPDCTDSDEVDLVMTITAAP